VKQEWPLWEVFVRPKAGLDHKHCGSLHAPDAGMAMQMAREVYTRRQEGTSVWVVKSSDITASDPGDKDMLFDPMEDKVYRHPTFYELPDEVEPHVRPAVTAVAESLRLKLTPAVRYLLRWADTCLIHAQRLAEWCGHGPVLEEDIALTNMALDLHRPGAGLLTRAGQLEGQGFDEDQLAFLRDEARLLQPHAGRAAGGAAARMRRATSPTPWCATCCWPPG
jgi:ring-1,2-phenylacetyl-CoA epoxidase subunit PaaB